MTIRPEALARHNRKALMRFLGWFIYLVLCIVLIRVYAQDQWKHSRVFIYEIVAHWRASS